MLNNTTDFTKLSQCQAVVCDLDGTLYLDNVPIHGSHEFLDKVLASGRQLFYFTNNTSLSRETWIKKLAAMDFPVHSESLLTSADCADAYLKRNGLAPNIYLVGNRDLITDFKSRGFFCMEEEAALQGTPQAVVLGFDTELTYTKIYACYQLIERGIPYVATHPDKLCPVTKHTFKPDVGSFIAMFETATGKRPVIVGKPTLEAVNLIGERAQLEPPDMAFIGDRLYTDIRMAVESGMTSVLVLSGETNERDVLASDYEPDILVPSVASLIDAL